MVLRDDIKERLQVTMYQLIDKQIDNLSLSKISIEQSKLNETKSSAGDKYETGRAMMQMEQDKIESQLNKLNNLRSHLKQIPSNLSCNVAQKGALVITDNGNFYISVSLGKIIIDGNVFYTLSPAAPLSKQMLGKDVNETINFRERLYKIMEIK